MKFQNTTPFPAELLVGSPGDLEMLGIVACKVTYVYRAESQRLEPAPAEEAWPIFAKEYVFDGVKLGPDLDYRQEGIDLIVFGKAVAPERKPVQSMVVAIQCGTLDHRVAVFGDRRWVRASGGLVPSEPEIFVEMPLTNDRAFGGSTMFEGLPFPHFTNPDGRGLALTEAGAEGSLLPNLERLDDRITAWNEYPVPACIHKTVGPLRPPGTPAPEDPVDAALEISDASFNRAVPELVLRPEHVGAGIRFFGCTAEGELVFPMPRLRGPSAHVRVGELRSRFPTHLASVVVLVDPAVVVATYRCVFRYLFRPEESREAVLRWEEDPAVSLPAEWWRPAAAGAGT